MSHEGQREPPPLGRRLERFVQRYIDSPLKLAIVRTVAHHPNRLYALDDLAASTETQPTDVERAIFQLEHLGLVSTRQGQNGILTGLARSPVVRDMGARLFGYATNPGGYAKLTKIVKARR